MKAITRIETNFVLFGPSKTVIGKRKLPYVVVKSFVEGELLSFQNDPNKGVYRILKKQIALYEGRCSVVVEAVEPKYSILLEEDEHGG